MIDTMYNYGLGLLTQGWWAGLAWPVLWALIKIVAVLAPLMVAVMFTTLWERKLLGYIQVPIVLARGAFCNPLQMH